MIDLVGYQIWIRHSNVIVMLQGCSAGSWAH